MLLNRIGDLCLLLAICLIFHLFGTLKYSVVFLLVPYFIDLNIYFLGFYFNCIDLICFFLFIGAMGKSAQIGLHI
jgi:NADH:ubiquinone oxidoreductase subunit 5 (subunit L)/multisubunit Na+/H+ antiporter MnhA subunit